MGKFGEYLVEHERIGGGHFVADAVAVLFCRRVADYLDGGDGLHTTALEHVQLIAGSPQLVINGKRVGAHTQLSGRAELVAYLVQKTGRPRRQAHELAVQGENAELELAVLDHT